ncbi:hypothetical protein psyc5s11_21690 [Clostridium gelidum]|uniref:Peptidase S8/S53 domain-containing protein n=1 Tax=Clostridium gelidum TaxID=704125 RepID=A0ABM7T488_9CLOT|nr:S8 family peptidase [Clostridium gelidum]BCZ46102.1 hypothetical protein psyc5s11_21690 [Clostridium gelidum]
MIRDVKAPDDLFTNKNYYHHVVEYQGNIQEELSKQPGYYVTIINYKYAIVSTMGETALNAKEPYFSSIVYVNPQQPFTLQQISPIDASGAEFLQLDLPLHLTGIGVNVGIIDTGIDYLSEEFMKPNGETRIKAIWDQTIQSVLKTGNDIVPYGTIYMQDEINNAIKAKKSGKSPYEIVASKDEIGHGTSMAGIIGATGKNPDLVGVCPECDFVVVKLAEDITYRNLYNSKVPIFNIAILFTAVQFLYEYYLTNNEPMVIYYPLGTNMGNHKGIGSGKEYVEEISSNSGLVMVTGTGNQGASGTHASGLVSQVGETSDIELYISPEQKNIFAEIWIGAPNIMSLEVISPSGENSGIINALLNVGSGYTYLFEKTSMTITYSLPEERSGDELISIRFSDLQQGIWKFRLTGELILDGNFNMWIPQEGITVGDTRFVLSDPYGTFMDPSDSEYLISVAAYNQNNNNIVAYSGRSFLSNTTIIDVAAGGVNALAVAPDNKTTVANGTSVAAAIVAGACVMLLQWGIVEGNDPNIYSETVRTYLQRGTVRRSGDNYPNAEWGYGMLNILLMFQNII